MQRTTQQSRVEHSYCGPMVQFGWYDKFDQVRSKVIINNLFTASYYNMSYDVVTEGQNEGMGKLRESDYIIKKNLSPNTHNTTTWVFFQQYIQYLQNTYVRHTIPGQTISWSVLENISDIISIIRVKGKETCVYAEPEQR